MIWALAQLQPDRPPPRAWLDRMLARGAATAAAGAAERAGYAGWASAAAEEAEAGAEGAYDGSLQPRHVAMLLLALARWRLARTRKG